MKSVLLVALAITVAQATAAHAQEPAPPWRGRTASDQRPKPFTRFSLSAERLRDSAVALARTQLGVRYRLGGESTKRGLDCSGLVRLILGKLDIALPRTAAQQARLGDEVPRDSALLRPGDVLTFGRGQRVDHVGVYVGDGKFVHASSSRGRVTESALPSGDRARWWKGVRRFLAAAEPRDPAGGSPTP